MGMMVVMVVIGLLVYENSTKKAQKKNVNRCQRGTNLELNVGVLIFRLILIATKGSNQTYLIIALILINFLIKKLAFQMDYEFII